MKTTILFRIKRVQQCKHIHAFLGLLPPFYARIKGISLLYSKEKEIQRMRARLSLTQVFSERKVFLSGTGID